jgi:hypothetical protein
VLDPELVQHADDRAAQVVAALGVLGRGDRADQAVQALLEGAVVDGRERALELRVGLEPQAGGQAGSSCMVTSLPAHAEQEPAHARRAADHD